MTTALPLADSIGENRARSRLFDSAPFVLIVLATWMKISYFNLPPDPNAVNEWYKWTPAEGARAAVSSLATLLIIFAPTLILRPIARYTVLVVIDFVLTLIVVGRRSNEIHPWLR